MPQICFFPTDRTHRDFFVLLHKRKIFSDGPKGFECILDLCELRAPISFFLLFGTNSSPEKLQHVLVSPNSIKIAPNGLFFGGATESEVLLC